MVGTAGFEPATPSPPDWCANQAAPRPEAGPKARNGRQDITATGAFRPLRGPPRRQPPRGPLPGPDPDHQPHRRALEPEGPPQVALEVAAVAGGELGAGEHDHLGRVDPGLGGVADLDRAAAHRGRGRALGGLPQPLVEGRGGDAPRTLGQHLVDQAPDLLDPPPGAGRDAQHRRPVHEVELALQVDPELAPGLVVHQVPLVGQQDQPAAGLDGPDGDLLVLLGHAEWGLEHEQGDVGPVDRLQAADEGEVVGPLGLLEGAAHAGGVDQPVAAAGPLDDRVDGVAGRARGRVDDGQVLAGQPVEQAGLADVGPADDRQRRHLGLVAGRRPGAEPLDDRVEQVARSPAVQAGHGQRLAQAERPQVGDLRLGGGAVDLVGDQQDGHAAAAQAGGDGGVLLGDPDGGVDDEQQEVGVGHRPLGLGDDAGLEAGRLGLPAAGVDQLEATAGPVGLVDDPVAGHARAAPG